MIHFEPFYDPDDLSACVEASSSIAELNSQAAKDGLYFPLWRDAGESFSSLYLGTRVCSRSFRFGSVGDNVMGCRFKLKNGKTVELGGRVVKNVVGLDLVRFFAGSRGVFGEPETLILRLRPLPEIRHELAIHGSATALETFRAAFMLSPWVHCVDAFDFEFALRSLRLGLAYACTKEEAPVYERALAELAKTHNCRIEPEALPQHIGRFEQRVPLSQALTTPMTGRVTGFLGHGTILTETGVAAIAQHPDLDERMNAILEALA